MLLPSGQVCLFCVNPAAYRCKSCGPLAFFCRNCFYVQDNEDDDDTDSEQEWEFNELIAIAILLFESIDKYKCMCYIVLYQRLGNCISLMSFASLDANHYNYNTL